MNLSALNQTNTPDIFAGLNFMEDESLPSNNSNKTTQAATGSGFFSSFESLCLRYAPEGVPCATIREGTEQAYTTVANQMKAIADSETTRDAISYLSSKTTSLYESINPETLQSAKETAANVGQTSLSLAKAGIRIGGSIGSAAKTVWDWTGTLTGEGGQAILAAITLLFLHNTFKREVIVTPPQPIYLPAPQDCDCTKKA